MVTFLGRGARTVTDHPVATISVVVALALAGVALALQLEPSASTDSLVGQSSEAARATKAFHEQFGDEAIVVLVKGPLERTVLTEDLGRLLVLEGCLSGRVPKGAEASLREKPRACQELAADQPVKIVYGPGTFVNTAANQISQGYLAKQQQAQADAKRASKAAIAIAKRQGYSRARQLKFGAEAERLVLGKFQGQLVQLGLRYGLTRLPRIDDPQFVSQLIFDGTRGVSQPKTRFAYLFPSSNAPLILIRLKPGLSDQQRDSAIKDIIAAVNDKNFKLANNHRYVVTGVPVVVDSL